MKFCLLVLKSAELLYIDATHARGAVLCPEGCASASLTGDRSSNFLDNHWRALLLPFPAAVKERSRTLGWTCRRQSWCRSSTWRALMLYQIFSLQELVLTPLHITRRTVSEIDLVPLRFSLWVGA